MADQQASSPCGMCGDWAAWHDHMPPGPPRLFVTGKCTFPTAGYGVTLQPSQPQGINPNILLLDKIITPPDPGCSVAQVETTVDVRYEEQTSREYTHVTLLPDDQTVPVQEVQ
jgi:hypothetical protein